MHKLNERITNEKVMCITIGYFVQRLLHALRKTGSLYNSILKKTKPGPCRRLTFAITLTTCSKSQQTPYTSHLALKSRKIYNGFSSTMCVARPTALSNLPPHPCQIQPETPGPLPMGFPFGANKTPHQSRIRSVRVSELQSIWG